MAAISLSTTDCGRYMVLWESMRPQPETTSGFAAAHGRDLERLFVAGLQPGMLAVGGQPWVESRDAEVVAHLRGHRAHQGALHAAHREGRAQHVEDARAEAEDQLGPRRRDLQGRGDAEKLRETLDDGAGECHGRGRAGDRHRVDLDRHAVSGQCDVDIEHRPLDLERRGRSDDRGDARPLAKAVEITGQHLADADDGVDLVAGSRRTSRASRSR